MIILEDLIDDPNFNYDDFIPDEEDFKRVVEAYNDVIANGDNCNYKNSADMMSIGAKPDWRIIRRLIIAVMLHWDELADNLKHKWLSTNHTQKDLKDVLKLVLMNKDEFEELANIYIEPINQAKKVEQQPQKITTPQQQAPQPAQQNTQQPQAAQQAVQYGFFMISAYDSSVDAQGNVTKGARRHIRVGKKDKSTGLYNVMVDSAELSAWENLFVFDNTADIKNFIDNVKAGKAKTSRPVYNYIYAINSKPYKQMRYTDLQNDFVAVNTTCGPAYICKYSSYCED